LAFALGKCATFVAKGPSSCLDGANGRPGYAVFGKVVSGMDVVDAIREVKTGPKTLRSLHPDGKLFPSPNGNVPMKDVEIKTIKRAENSP